MSRIVLTNIDLLDVVAGTTRAGCQILIEGELIREVSGNGVNAAGARVIDLGGRTVMPGLIDCHVHICAKAMHEPPTVPPSYAAYVAADCARGMLVRGFTTVRDVAGADAGHRRAAAEGRITSPRLFVAGHPLSQTGGHGDGRGRADWRAPAGAETAGSWSVIADGVTEVRRAAREQIRRGVDHVKIMASGGISSPADPVDYLQYSSEEIEAVVDEAGRANRYVAAHAYTSPAIARAVQAGVRTIEHGNFLDEPTARLMAERGAFLVPTLIVYRKVMELGEKLGLPRFQLEKAAEITAVGTRSLEVAGRAGVKMAYGSDLFRMPDEHQAEELLLRAEVLAPMEILRSATLVGAEVVGMAGRLGTIREGASADLLAVDGNPAEDLSLLQNQGAHLALIMKAGEIVKTTLGSG